jgi:hypothetical protein
VHPQGRHHHSSPAEPEQQHREGGASRKDGDDRHETPQHAGVIGRPRPDLNPPFRTTRRRYRSDGSVAYEQHVIGNWAFDNTIDVWRETALALDASGTYPWDMKQYALGSCT